MREDNAPLALPLLPSCVLQGSSAYARSSQKCRVTVVRATAVVAMQRDRTPSRRSYHFGEGSIRYNGGRKLASALRALDQPTTGWMHAERVEGEDGRRRLERLGASQPHRASSCRSCNQPRPRPGRSYPLARACALRVSEPFVLCCSHIHFCSQRGVFCLLERAWVAIWNCLVLARGTGHSAS